MATEKTQVLAHIRLGDGVADRVGRLFDEHTQAVAKARSNEELKPEVINKQVEAREDQTHQTLATIVQEVVADHNKALEKEEGAIRAVFQPAGLPAFASTDETNKLLIRRLDQQAQRQEVAWRLDALRSAESADEVEDLVDEILLFPDNTGSYAGTALSYAHRRLEALLQAIPAEQRGASPLVAAASAMRTRAENHPSPIKRLRQIQQRRAVFPPEVRRQLEWAEKMILGEQGFTGARRRAEIQRARAGVANR